MKINYKSICKSLNEYAESNSYDNSATIRAELTSFEATHRVNRGRNGVSELLELQTRIIEASAVHVSQWDRSDALTVYLYSDVRVDHGFGSDKGIYLRVRDAKGKYHSIEIRTDRAREFTEVDRLVNVLGTDTPAKFAPEEFQSFIELESSNVVKLVEDASEPETESMTRWKLEGLQRQFAKKFYADMINYEFDRKDVKRFETLLDSIGFKLIKFFQFNERFWGIRPDFVNATSQGLEIGWTNRSTYNSLPYVLKITKAREIKTVKLSDLGIEGSGYYSHSDRMQIRPEQVEAAKRFSAKFRSKKNKVIKQTLELALKAS